ncbi:MAG: hypothetical protein M1833_003603 [Piccolia ochrophora]|nr:MAG: hypothetical protein M1833_003603 [Piccolia ochrophora]
MSDDAPSADETPITFNVKSSSDAKYVLTLPLSTTIIDLKNKLASPEYADIPADRQRLIYSGRVLKDPDSLDAHKVKDGHTIHLVKSASSNQRQNPSSPAAAATASSGSGAGAGAGPGSAGVPSMATGTGNNPLAGLTGARYAGHVQLPGAGMFGPDGGMGAPPDPEQMLSMFQDPNFASLMNEALQNPDLINTMIQQNPMLREMGPQARQMLQSPEFRRIMTDPEAMRSTLQIGRSLGLDPMGGMGAGAAGAAGGFPAPGITDTTRGAQGEGAATGGGATQTPGQTNTTGAPPNPFAFLGNPGAAGGGNPFAALFGNPGAPPGNAATSPPTGGQGGPQNTEGSNSTQSPPPNPFANLFNPALFGQATGNTPGNNQDPSQPQQPGANPFANNPLMQNPQAMQQLLATMMGGQGGQGGQGSQGASGAYNPFAAFGGQQPTPSNPPDDRPPEERYAEQLRQLNDMGFYDFDRNIEALRRTGGSVQGAVEYLLSH